MFNNTYIKNINQSELGIEQSLWTLMINKNFGYSDVYQLNIALKRAHLL